MVKKRCSWGTYNTDTKYKERPHGWGMIYSISQAKNLPRHVNENQRTPLYMLKGQFLIKYFYTKGILTDKLVPNTMVEYLYTSTKSSCMLLGIVYGGYQCPSGN